MARTSARQLLRSHTLSALDVSIGARFVLVALADHADADGISFPSQETLADETGMQRSAVRKALTALEAARLIQVLDPGGPRKSARYLLLLGVPLRATG